MSLDSWNGFVAAPIGEFLRPREFRKSGFKFTAARAGATLTVGLQGSMASTREALKVTCNLAIHLQELGSRDRPDVWDAHWRKRIGFYMSEPRDHWWVCSTDEAAKAAGREIAALLENAALPEMERLASPAAMVALWRSGRSPGLTDYQRVGFLTEFTQEGT